MSGHDWRNQADGEDYALAAELSPKSRAASRRSFVRKLDSHPAFVCQDKRGSTQPVAGSRTQSPKGQDGPIDGAFCGQDWRLRLLEDSVDRWRRDGLDTEKGLAALSARVEALEDQKFVSPKKAASVLEADPEPSPRQFDHFASAFGGLERANSTFQERLQAHEQELSELRLWLGTAFGDGLQAQLDLLRSEVSDLQRATAAGCPADLGALAVAAAAGEEEDLVTQHLSLEEPGQVASASRRLQSMKREVEALSASFKEVKSHAPSQAPRDAPQDRAGGLSCAGASTPTRGCTGPLAELAGEASPKSACHADVLAELELLQNSVKDIRTLADEQGRDAKVVSLRLEVLEQGLAAGCRANTRSDTEVCNPQASLASPVGREPEDEKACAQLADEVRNFVDAMHVEQYVSHAHKVNSRGSVASPRMRSRSTGARRDEAQRAAEFVEKALLKQQHEHQDDGVEQPRVSEAATTRLARVENEVHQLSTSLKEVKLLVQQFEEMNAFVSGLEPGSGSVAAAAASGGSASPPAGNTFSDDELSASAERILASRDLTSMRAHLSTVQTQLLEMKQAVNHNSLYAVETNSRTVALKEALSHLVSDVGGLKSVDIGGVAELKETAERCSYELSAIRAEVHVMKEQASKAPDTQHLAEQLQEVIQGVLPRVIKHEESIEKELGETKRAIEDARVAAEADSRELMKKLLKLSLHLGSVEGIVACGHGPRPAETAAAAQQFFPSLGDEAREVDLGHDSSPSRRIADSTQAQPKAKAAISREGMLASKQGDALVSAVQSASSSSWPPGSPHVQCC